VKRVYRGYEIEAHRERCLGGWPLLYFSIFRVRDGRECVAGFEDSSERVVTKMKHLRERVDAELALPARQRWMDEYP
jgi:hypothetical protein